MAGYILPFRDLPVEASQGWKLAAPPTTHMKDVSCPESKCRAYTNGWETIVPVDSAQADYIRRSSGRRFKEETTADNLSRFLFESGQECFERHMQRNDRDAIPIRRIAHERRVVEYDHWLWDFHEETYKMKRERG
jgi:hypothetical protein